MQVSWHDAAIEDAIEAAAFYESGTPGRGPMFSQAVRSAVAAIKAAPDRYEVVFGRVRRYIIDGYSYSIYYRLKPDVIRILTVKHHARDPNHGIRRR